VTVELEIRVCPIEISDEQRRTLSATLTADERARMASFYRDADARRFLVGRATLRRVLADHLAVAPLEVPLAFGPNGKPEIAGELRVNVSHSGDVVLVALAHGVEIGVDVEHADERHASGTRLDAFFSPREIRDHLALPSELRLASFFHIWTSKEAIVKAVAAGLSIPLESFDVAVDPRRPPALLAARCPELAGIPISLAAIEVPAGHVAAAAALAERCSVRYA
jgi:4'-phosphopantetheinyl transferase